MCAATARAVRSGTVSSCRLPRFPARPGRLSRIPAVWLVVTGIFSVQFGAAIAKHLFPIVPPTAMVWLRLATSTVVFVILARPRFRGRSRTDWLVALAFGVSLVTMNWAIYQSFARIPLGSL